MCTLLCCSVFVLFASHFGTGVYIYKEYLINGLKFDIL
jgi:hypothetical protein